MKKFLKELKYLWTFHKLEILIVVFTLIAMLLIANPYIFILP